MNTHTNLIAGVARSGILVTLNIGLYSGRKKDTKTQAEVVASKGAGSARAASVYRHLFADCPELDAITKFQARARARHYQLTLPWADSGARLLPTRALLDYKADMNRYRDEFDRLVEAFLIKYDTLIAAAAFKLGTMFDRDEYLTRDEVAKRFRFDIDMAPLPTAGDFRLDVESEVQQELVSQYEKRLAAQVAQAQQDAWTRAYEALSHIKDRLTLTEDGKPKVFHETTITNAQELCALLTTLNVANDPDLERARRMLEDAITGVDAKELRKVEGARLETLHKVTQVLDAFDWGTDV